MKLADAVNTNACTVSTTGGASSNKDNPKTPAIDKMPAVLARRLMAP